MAPRREDRLSKEKQRDQRGEFERDRDRLLYAGVFRRLVGVTQVVSPGEGEIYHNRPTHTLKVAQSGQEYSEVGPVAGKDEPLRPAGGEPEGGEIRRET